jgi:hypothetical protein
MPLRSRATVLGKSKGGSHDPTGNSQDWARNGVYSGHIVDRCDDLETAHEQIIARCYNRKKDGSLGYWKHSSFTHHDFEVMCRLVRDSGYLLTHFLEAVGLTEWADPPKKSDDVAEATHQKALKQAREDLWGDLTSNRPPFANSPGQDHREIGIFCQSADALA